MTRTCLTATAEVFINASTGDDATGDGTASLPFKTLQRGSDFAQRTFDLMGQYAVIYQGSGWLKGGVVQHGGLLGQADPNHQIFNFSYGSVVEAAPNGRCFLANHGAKFAINQPEGVLTLKADGADGIGVAASDGGFINVLTTTTFDCRRNAAQTSWGGMIILNSAWYTGTGEAAWYASGGVIQANPGQDQIFVTSSYSKATAWAYNGTIGIDGQTFYNTPTGARYAAEQCGVIVGNGGATYIPGSLPGYVATGGQYS